MRLVALLAALLLASCAEAQPARGTAQAHAVAVEVQAAAAAKAADAAELDAAQAAGDEARAAELAELAEARAVATPTADLIGRAAAARLALAEARAAARSTQVRALALRERSDAAAGRIAAAVRAAGAERAAEDAAAQERWWRGVGIAAGFAGLAAGVLLGGLVAWLLKMPRQGIALGALVAAAGLSCLLLAYALPYAGVVLLSLGGIAVALLVAAAWWAWRHRSDLLQGNADLALATAASRALDAVEAEPRDGLREVQDAAKRALGAAVDAAGRRAQLENLRGDDRAWAATNAASAAPQGAAR